MNQIKLTISTLALLCIIIPSKLYSQSTSSKINHSIFYEEMAKEDTISSIIQLRSLQWRNKIPYDYRNIFIVKTPTAFYAYLFELAPELVEQGGELGFKGIKRIRPHVGHRIFKRSCESPKIPSVDGSGQTYQNGSTMWMIHGFSKNKCRFYLTSFSYSNHTYYNVIQNYRARRIYRFIIRSTRSLTTNYSLPK